MSSKNSTTRELTDVLYRRVVSMLNRRRSREWVGTMTELSDALTRRSMPENWPTNPAILRRVLNSAERSLAKDGIEISFSRGKERLVALKG